jgi:O-antigen ligase
MFHVKQVTSSPYQKEGRGRVAHDPQGTFFTGWNISIVILIFIGTIQSIIGVIQVFIQHSVGLSLLRESLISPALPGVAKIMFHGEHYIRAYGLFPHPNILGGFLLFTIILTLLYTKIASCLPRETKLFHACLSGRQVEHSLRSGTVFTNLLYFSLAIQLLALFFSFSKSAILGLLVALIYIYVPRLPRWFRLFHVEQSETLRGGTFENFTGWNNSRIRIIILTILVVIALIFIFNQDLGANLKQSIEERLTYLNVSRETILASPILGVGIGQFVWNMERYSPVPLEIWQLQPVHNIFLLFWSELGVIGVGLFIYWLYRLFTAKPILCNDNNYLSNIIPLRYFKGILLGFIIIMLFDHYFWDIQQGSLMLWMTLGFVAGLRRL